MKVAPPDCWTDKTSVFFTSFWGWSPESWATIGWTGDEGRTRRTNLLKELSDPFIAVIYVTKTAGTEQDGKIVGFYLMKHETGVRNEFTHPSHHSLDPGKWEHSLRAIRAFSYIPEYALEAFSLFPELSTYGRTVAKWGEVITDKRKIAKLQNTPWMEVGVYGFVSEEAALPAAATQGFNKAGPSNSGGYVVNNGTAHLPRLLYILRLNGETAAFLGKSADGKAIYKIGLSISPEIRRQAFQSALPTGAFHWELFRTQEARRNAPGPSFEAAVAGEDAMKQHLAKAADWLGGEFYLATEVDIEAAWKKGCIAAKGFWKATSTEGKQR